MDATPEALTIGHSTHPIDEFTGLLREAKTSCLIDVRTLPGSRHNPQFNEENLAPSLNDSGIDYVREKRLGGLRSSKYSLATEINGFWQNKSFHRYADYALSDDFQAGFDRLRDLIETGSRPAIMCAEAVWWRCHRRIITDRLLALQVPVGHVMPDGRIQEATLTKGARVHDDGTVTYPAVK